MTIEEIVQIIKDSHLEGVLTEEEIRTIAKEIASYKV